MEREGEGGGRKGRGGSCDTLIRSRNIAGVSSNGRGIEKWKQPFNMCSCMYIILYCLMWYASPFVLQICMFG